MKDRRPRGPETRPRRANVAATLPARTVSLSAEALRRLESGKRRAFKKHRAPVVYIPADDPRP
jgi:hypothetical protein